MERHHFPVGRTNTTAVPAHLKWRAHTIIVAAPESHTFRPSLGSLCIVPGLLRIHLHLPQESYSAGLDAPGNTQQTWSHWLGVRWRRGWVLFMATAHPTVSIQHYSSTGVRVKFLSIQHYYFFLEGEKFQLVDYKKIASIQLFFIYTTRPMFFAALNQNSPGGYRIAPCAISTAVRHVAL